MKKKEKTNVYEVIYTNSNGEIMSYWFECESKEIAQKTFSHMIKNEKKMKKGKKVKILDVIKVQDSDDPEQKIRIFRGFVIVQYIIVWLLYMIKLFLGTHY